MKLTYEETRTVTVVTGYVCNRCEVRSEVGDWNHQFTHVEYSGGYNSRIGDGIELSFELCDSCLINIMAEFKIKPKKNCAGWLGGGVADEDGNPEDKGSL